MADRSKDNSDKVEQPPADGAPADVGPAVDPQALPAPRTLREAFRGRWQMPLALIGLLLVLTGLPRLMSPPVPVVTLEDHVRAARQMIDAGRFERAADYLQSVLEGQWSEPETSRLRLILADARYRQASGSASETLRGSLAAEVLNNLAAAVAAAGGEQGLDGSLVTPGQLHARLAEAYLWTQNVKAADAELRKGFEALRPEEQEQRRALILLGWNCSRDLVRGQLEGMAARAQASDDDRMWAARQLARLVAAEAKDVRQRDPDSRIAAAVQLLEEQRGHMASPDAQDQLDVAEARILWSASDDRQIELSPAQRQANLDQAERILDAVELRHKKSATQAEMEAEMHWLRGEVQFAQQRPGPAIDEFATVTREYEQSGYVRASRLGLAKSYALYSKLKDALDAYNQVVTELREGHDDPLVDRQAVQQSLLMLHRQLFDNRDWEQAYRFGVLLEMILPQDSKHPSPVEVKQMQAVALQRLAFEHKKQADHVRGLIASGRLPADRKSEVDRFSSMAHETLLMAAEAYLQAAYMETASEKAGNDLHDAWFCFDQAGEIQRAIAVLKKFVAEHPADQQRIAQAIFNLGKAYQAAGLCDNAIEQYQRLVDQFAKSPDANKAQVPMAQCYKSLGQLDKAETIIRALLADDQTFSPDSEEYTEALFELGRLKYEQADYREAIARLDEALQRYPDNPQALYARYYLADSYRRSGLVLDDAITSAKTPLEKRRLTDTRAAWLRQGRALFDQVILAFEALRQGSEKPLGELDWLYMRNSHFFRADCMFALGDYDEAIRLYDRAAMEYHDQPEALSAYVRIITCYVLLDRPEQARTANERARWLLKKLPAAGFAQRPLPMSKDYFDDWLKWAGDAGLW
ncbi:MAG: hypothetical protein BIFFINMI_03048 [Phycisphaerae bacterium]|nr:hypothetical protein [Phycisphaerae bacterium]